MRCNLMCAALPDGSLLSKNYATRARPSVPDGPYVPKGKTFARKAIKKERRETREDFSQKRKVYAFRGNSALEKSPWKFSRKEKKYSAVGPARSKGKLIPTGRKGFSAQLVIVSAVRASMACSPTSSIPALLHLQPAVASSRLRPPSPLATSCPTPPSSHSNSRRRQPVSPTSPGPLRYARCPPPPLCFPFPRSLRECRYLRPHKQQSPPPASAPGFACPQVRALSPPLLCFPFPPQPMLVPLPPPVVRAPGTLYAAPVAVFALTSNNRRRQPVPPVLHTPRNMRCYRLHFASSFPRNSHECCRRRRPWFVPRIPDPPYILHRRPRSCLNPSANRHQPLPSAAIQIHAPLIKL
jgi:hypothetical protein